MKNRKLTVFFILLLIILFSVPFASANDSGTITQTLEELTGQIVRIRTRGGGEFQGILLTTSPERIELQNAEGQILQIAIPEITKAFLIDTYYQDAAANKLLLMPLGFGMDAGEFHIADQELIIVSASYGVSEHFSLWGAVSVPGVLLNARFSFEPGKKTGISLGSFLGTLFILPTFIAMPYGIISFGSLNNNLTIGLGVPFIYGRDKSNEEDSESEYMVLGGVAAVGGKIVISQTASFITENWIILARGYDRIAGLWWDTVMWFLPTVAFRIAGSRFSWDIGITIPLLLEYSVETDGYRFLWAFVDNVPVPIPILGFTYRIK